MNADERRSMLHHPSVAGIDLLRFDVRTSRAKIAEELLRTGEYMFLVIDENGDPEFRTREDLRGGARAARTHGVA